MAVQSPTSQQPATSNSPIALHERAMENISFIRDTMARSAPVTSVSGWGTVGMGVIALIGAYVAAGQRDVILDHWIYVWCGVAALGCLSGFGAMVLKAGRGATPAYWATLRRFGFALFPPIAAGMILTNIFYERGLAAFIPGTWLLLYGVGIMTGGAFSVPLLPLMGAGFLAMGTFAFYPPVPMDTVIFGAFTVADAFLAFGFGVFHIFCGLVIAWRYGG